jgi:ribosome recycling factor
MEKELLFETRQKMEEVVGLLKDDLSTIRTGRASPSLVEDIKVEAYQVRVRLLELAHITVPEPTQISIRPYDPGNTGSIKKAILEANIGLNPIIDGDVIFVSIPPLTEERREEFIKAVNQKLEGARILIRQARQETMEKIEKAFEEKKISEDERFRLKDQVQDIVDKFNGQVEGLGEGKKKDLMEI